MSYYNHDQCHHSSHYGHDHRDHRNFHHSHFYHDHHHSFSHHSSCHHHGCKGHSHKDCHCSYCSGHFRFGHLCSHDFRVRLGGLQGGLAFRFRQLLDCDVKLNVDCEGEEKAVKGRVCFVGTNFVEIRSKRKQAKLKRSGSCKRRTNKGKKYRYRIIPFDKICSIEL
ncbi:hypothetical protein [Mesobacillus maritimus]|uniref:Spore coat protein n=1 Tax=Mesobacillus maritimus TaxID=1643336 RepID=A0ABS7K0W1_9BACI|nr:hypothetical protein [Mesobacillus maritimus]MBY0095887.1 hypothetical protein [Mesobacillus maritimus]